MASIEKRPPRARGGKSTYRVRYRDPVGAQRSKSFTSLTAARAFQSTVESDKLRGTYVDLQAGRMTLGEYVDLWLEVQTFGPTTRERREQSLRLHVVPQLGQYQLAELRPTTIQGWIKTMSLSLAPRTVRELFRLVSSILGSAVEDERIAKNPCRSKAIRVPRPDERPFTPWSVDQVAAIRGALPERYVPLATLVTGLGLRQGEVFGLAVEDVDFLRRVVTVRRQVTILGSRLVFALPKGRKVRTVPLPESVANELAAYLQRFPARDVTLPWGGTTDREGHARLILTTREGKALNRNYINSYIWRPALQRAGITACRENMMHGGRHFYASLQLEHGMSPRALADYLGHADPAFMMKTYTHLMPEAPVKAAAAVDDLFARIDAGRLQSDAT